MYEHSHESPSLCERHVDAANPSVRPHETCPLEPEVTPCGYPMEMSSFSESRAAKAATSVRPRMSSLKGRCETSFFPVSSARDILSAICRIPSDSVSSARIRCSCGLSAASRGSFGGGLQAARSLGPKRADRAEFVRLRSVGLRQRVFRREPPSVRIPQRQRR